MQKAIVNSGGRPRRNKANIIESHLQAAWIGIEGEMTAEEFARAAYEAAAVIGLRDRLSMRIASGEIKVRSPAL